MVNTAGEVLLCEVLSSAAPLSSLMASIERTTRIPACLQQLRLTNQNKPLLPSIAPSGEDFSSARRAAVGARSLAALALYSGARLELSVATAKPPSGWTSRVVTVGNRSLPVLVSRSFTVSDVIVAVCQQVRGGRWGGGSTDTLTRGRLPISRIGVSFCLGVPV